MSSLTTGSPSGSATTGLGVTPACDSAPPTMTPISRRLRNGTTARIPGRARPACASSTSYVKVRKSGSGRATETSTQLSYRARQPDRERRPIAEHTADGNLATQLLRQPSRDAEPEPRSAVGARSRLVELTEILPDHADLLGLDADAGVAHLEHDRVLGAVDGDANRSAVGELRGIGQQVEQNLLQLRLVGVDRRTRRAHVDAERQVLR